LRPNPELPATITLSEPKLANLQLQIGQAKAGPLVRAVSATGSVGYDQLHLPASSLRRAAGSRQSM